MISMSDHHIWSLTWVTDGIQSFHSVQVVVATLEKTDTFLLQCTKRTLWRFRWEADKSDWLIWDPCFSLSSSSDRSRGSKRISWTLDSLESISSLKPCKWIHEGNTQTRELLLLSDNLRGKQFDMRGDPLYLRCIVANRCVRTSAGSHCKAHDLPLYEDEQQHKHLRPWQDRLQSSAPLHTS